MAGAQDDNNRQHYKKPQNRQDYNANAKRKNSIAGKNKDLHNNTLSASGTVTSSPTTPTSTSSNTSFAGPGPALPSLKPTIEHVPVNSFNSQEVSNYLNNTWKETLDRYHDNNLSEAEKPEMYKSTEKAWVAKGGPAWGNKGNLMASGNDFFAELRKSSLVQVSNAQPATAK